MEIASFIISLIAILIAIGAAFYTRRQAAEAKEANALTKAAHQRELTDREAHRLANRVVWRVDRAETGLALRNIGTETAEDVEAWTHATPFKSGPLVDDAADPRKMWLAVPSVPSGSSVRFELFPQSLYSGTGSEMLVTWRGQTEPVAVPLPGTAPDGGGGGAAPRPEPRWT